MSTVLLTALTLIAAAPFACAQYEEDGYALMVQESPAGAGKITPGIGVHDIGLNDTVTLTAMPRPGYDFVYWLGDVTNPSTNETTITVTGPKIVVAVFERTEFELLERSDTVTPGSGRDAMGLVRSDFRMGPAVNPADHRNPHFKFPPFTPPEENFPVPEARDPIPVPGEDEPIPEPNTLIILATGAFLGIRKRRKK